MEEISWQKVTKRLPTHLSTFLNQSQIKISENGFALIGVHEKYLDLLQDIKLLVKINQELSKELKQPLKGIKVVSLSAYLYYQESTLTRVDVSLPQEG